MIHLPITVLAEQLANDSTCTTLTSLCLNVYVEKKNLKLAIIAATLLRDNIYENCLSHKENIYYLHEEIKTGQRATTSVQFPSTKQRSILNK